MKKLLFICLTLLALTACSATTAIHEVSSIPSNVQQSIDENTTIQLIQTSEKQRYVVLHAAAGDVNATLDVQDDTLTISFETANDQGQLTTPHVYEFTTATPFEKIQFLVNGEETSVGMVIGS